MFWLLLILITILFLILLSKGIPAMCDDYEEETVTTTYEEPDGPNIVGNLKRQVEGEQAFVLDPVDGEKIWLNSNDDMYEDADGRIWRLI